jgi:hypothetical protein
VRSVRCGFVAGGAAIREMHRASLVLPYASALITTRGFAEHSGGDSRSLLSSSGTTVSRAVSEGPFALARPPVPAGGAIPELRLRLG